MFLTNDSLELRRLILSKSTLQISYHRSVFLESWWEMDVPNVENKLLYSVDDKPPLVLAIFLGFQQILTTASTTLAVPFILGYAVCLLDADPARVYITSTIFLVCGISTIVQCIFGARLPVQQVPSISFLICVTSLLRLPQWGCPPDVDLFAMGADNRTAEWQDRMREIQGAVISVSLLEMLIGYSGLIGFLSQFLTPISISAPLIAASFSMISSTSRQAATNWYVAFLTVVSIVICCQCLKKIRTPIPWYTISKGWHIKWIYGFQLFPILIPVFFISSICGILSANNVFDLPSNNFDRSAPWFNLPYPGQWGAPRFSYISILTFTVACFTEIIVATGLYEALANVCDVPRPSDSAFNRGIGCSGIGSLLCGLFGTGLGLTTSLDPGTIALTKVGSRRVVICGAIISIVLGLVPKLIIFLAVIPESLYAGINYVSFAMLAATGFSVVSEVDMKSHRNMFVLGASVFFSMSLSSWMNEHPEDLIFTNCSYANITFRALFENPFVAALLVSLVMDYGIPGSPNGMDGLKWKKPSSEKKLCMFPLCFLRTLSSHKEKTKFYSINLWGGINKGKMASRSLNIDEPRYDQSTYWGRCQYFFSTTNPLNLFNSNETLEKSRKIVLAAREKRWSEVEKLSDEEIWRAKELYDSAFHPDTGELMNPIGRMSAQVPMNMAITGCMMNFYKSTPAVIFWQWVNQSFNALVNYTNRSGDAAISTQQIMTSYVLATGGALTTALTLNRMTKRLHPLVGRCVPFVAVAAANCINIPMMRMQELQTGIPVTDEAGNRLGDSKQAAKAAIVQTTLSRIGMASPGMILTPIVMNRLDQSGLFLRRPWLSTPLSVLICGVCLTFATPMCCALFEQRASMSVSSLEDDLKEKAEKKGLQVVYYNKGL